MTDWIDVCAAGEIDVEDVIRFDHGGRTFAIYRGPTDDYFCTDGLCTHEHDPPRRRAGHGPCDRMPQAQRAVRL